MLRKLGIVTASLCLIAFFILEVNAQENWYKNKLREGQQYITDFTLAAGSSKSITIDSEKDTIVGFITNISYKKGREYIAQKSNPIELRADMTVAKSVFGAGTIFKPVGGKITILAINNSKEEVKIVIYVKNKLE